MGIKLGNYVVQPVHKVVGTNNDKKKQVEERLEEQKNMQKVIRMYTRTSIDVKI